MLLLFVAPGTHLGTHAEYLTHFLFLDRIYRIYRIIEPGWTPGFVFLGGTDGAGIKRENSGLGRWNY
jgi:hypothetical protein